MLLYAFLDRGIRGYGGAGGCDCMMEWKARCFRKGVLVLILGMRELIAATVSVRIALE